MVVDIRLYELIKNNIGENDAETLVQILEEKMDNKIDQRKHELATKEDLKSLRKEFDDLRGEFHKLRIEVKDDIIHLRTELLRTIYLTSIGQLVAIIASVVSLVI